MSQLLRLARSIPLTPTGWCVLAGSAGLYGSGTLLGYLVLVGLAAGGAVLPCAPG